MNNLSKLYSCMLLIIMLWPSTGYTQHFFEKSFTVSFPHNQSGMVSYIQIPKGLPFSGIVEVSLTGGYNYQLNRGLLSKRIDIVYGGGTVNTYLSQSSEIAIASEPLALQWNIGDFDSVRSVIPVYHLTSIGNDISVTIRMNLLHENYIAPLQSGITMSEAVFEANTAIRPYRFFADSRIGIGTSDPEYRLDVVGGVRAHELRVETTKTADYVFEEGYNLPDLKSVQQFIKENGHLPDIPSAAEMHRNGINVGDLQIDLLKKVEELTLYMIELSVANKQLKNEQTEMKKQIHSQQQEIKKLRTNKRILK